MPPSIRAVQELIDEDYTVGGVEVIADQDHLFQVEVLDKLVFLPSGAPSLVEADDDDDDEDDEEEEDAFEQSVEVSDNFLDSLLFSCGGLNPCVPETPPIKGILRKPGMPSPPLNDHRTVSFSSLDIKEFGITLGNHPNSCSGPPIRLDWEAKKGERTMSLDEYEQTRNPRRKRRQMRYSYRHRKGVLEGEKGFSEEEVNEAWTEALKIQQQRQETLKRGLLMMTIDDVWESTQRKFKRIAETVGMV